MQLIVPGFLVQSILCNSYKENKLAKYEAYLENTLHIKNLLYETDHEASFFVSFLRGSQ
jgi:hypothetical protein